MIHRGLKIITLREGRTPPTELLLIPIGVYQTTKGDFTLTKEGARRIIAQLSDEGLNTPDRGINIDWEHDSLMREPGDGPCDSAGWFNVELRADGLWATNIRWTDDAAKRLSSASYRYISPAFAVDEETGEILSFANFALTNRPATKSARPLVAASRNTTQGNTMHKKFLAALAKYMSDNKLDTKGMSEKCGADVGKMMADGAEPPSQEEMAKCAKAMGMEMSSLDGGDVEDTNSTDEDEAEDAPAAGKGKREAAGGEVDVEGEDKYEQLSSLVSEAVGQVLVKLTGEKNPTRAQAMLLAQKEKAMQYDDLNKRLAVLTKEREDEKRERMIEANKSKLTPSLIKHFSKKPLADLEAYLEVAPDVMSEERHRPEGSARIALLTKEDKEVANLLSRDLDDVAKGIEAQRNGEFQRQILASYTARPKAR